MKSKEKTKKYTTAKVDSIRKRFAVGCLAVLMCGTALFGVACTPTTATSGTQGIGSSSSANGGGNLGTNTSPFGLDPANDPVVYTTAGGLEIKCSNALTNTSLASYTYFTMGEYNGTPLNWVIIGYDPSVSGYVGEFSGEVDDVDPIQGDFSFGSTVDNSPMGNAIKKEMFAISSSAVENDEIGDGCVLCFAEDIITSTTYGSNNKYRDSSLRTFLTNMLDRDLSFSDSEKALLQPRDLTSAYCFSTLNVQYDTLEDQYIFPLAGNNYGESAVRKENFERYIYLGEGESSACGDIYWTRSSTASGKTYTMCVNTNGTALHDVNYAICTKTYGVRPAFVMKLI